MSLSPDFISELRKHFTGDIRMDAATRALYSTDASIYRIEPLGAALPKTQDDLIAAVELAAKYKIPILPRGSGSSLAGQAIGQALILDCSRYLDKIICIDPEARTAKVEPGVVLSTLNRAAAKQGLSFGPDPASAERATMGGVIGNNATGAHSILYGMTADHLISADVILSDGSLATFGEMSIPDHLILDTRYADIVSAALEIREKYAEIIKEKWPRAWRNSAGYRLNYLLPWSASKPPQWTGNSYPPNLQPFDKTQGGPSTFNLAALLSGSEGTLAVIRSATVNLILKPKHTILGVLSYESVAVACDAVPALLDTNPSAVELIPQMLIRLARSVPAYASQLGFVQGDPAALLVVEFSGDDPALLREKAKALSEAAGRPDLLIAETAADQASVWLVRKVGLGIFDSRPNPARPVAFIEDCAIPVRRLGDFVREVERILAAHGTDAAFYAHASAGTLHIRPILNLKTDEGVRALRAIAEQVLALTIRVGGAMSSEHGDGLARSEWLTQTYGEQVVEAFKSLKRAADPDSLLNPKKLTEAPPMDTHLRYGADYRSQAWKPGLDFSRQGGLTQAVQQCNGQGMCRKLATAPGEGGVMCPSFQATRDEQNSTRGRANLLRGLITQSSIIASQPSVTQDHVFHALDLCLACKGCTAECPSGVDMAKLKHEFMNEYHKTHARPLRDYLFGYFHLVAALAAPFAPLVNFATKNALLKRLTTRIFQITPERSFPVFSSQRAKVRRSAAGARPAVIFFSDPFTHYVEPQVEQAAFDVLDLAGFDVRVLPVIGPGASLLSKGLIGPARRRAARTLDGLARMDPDVSLAVVGVEPPELYMLKNDYVSLLPARADEIKRRAENTWLVEEFLARAGVFERWRAMGLSAGENVKFQPHCHQRAEGPAPDGLPNGANATVALLQACGYHVDTLQTGCCGMAGTFGYDAEHYELSMQVGALQVFPQVKAAGDALVSSTGAACRMHITHGTGTAVTHPLVLAAKRLKGES